MSDNRENYSKEYKNAGLILLKDYVESLSADKEKCKFVLYAHYPRNNEEFRVVKCSERATGGKWCEHHNEASCLTARVRETIEGELFFAKFKQVNGEKYGNLTAKKGYYINKGRQCEFDRANFDAVIVLEGRAPEPPKVLIPESKSWAEAACKDEVKRSDKKPVSKNHDDVISKLIYNALAEYKKTLEKPPTTEEKEVLEWFKKSGLSLNDLKGLAHRECVLVSPEKIGKLVEQTLKNGQA